MTTVGKRGIVFIVTNIQFLKKNPVILKPSKKLKKAIWQMLHINNNLFVKKSAYYKYPYYFVKLLRLPHLYL